MKIFIRFIFIINVVSFLFPNSKNQLSDQRIANMIPKYFNREHHSPNIKRISIYAKENEKYLHLEIDVNRNRYEGELDFTLNAMANITQYAKIPFDNFIVIMYPAIKSKEPEIIKADAGCTIDYLINKRTNKKRWLARCVKISTDFENFVVPNSSSTPKNDNSSDKTIYYILLLVALPFIFFIFLRRK